MDNVFLKPPEGYVRDHDVIANWKRTAAKNISIRHRITVGDAMTWIEAKLAGDIKPVSPQMKVLKREPEMDRYKTKIDFIRYLEWVSDNGHALAPNLIAYANSELALSYLSEFVLENMDKRDRIKKAGHEAEMRGNQGYADFCELDQANCKFVNNSVSGSTISPHNPLYYITSHTTLTGTCRSCTTFANLVNEKLLSSNRFYFSVEVLLTNIADIASRAPYDLIAPAMERYGLVYPSVEYAFDLSLRCLERYVIMDASKAADIRQSLEGLTSLELAAFVYVGDLNALRDLNGGVVREWFSQLMFKPTTPIVNAEEIVKGATDDLIALAGILNADYLTGVSVKTLKEENYEQFQLYASHLKSMGSVLEEWHGFIHAFISTDIMPADLHSAPQMQRETVVASDTDSSIFHTENFVIWHQGTNDFSPTANSVSAITAFISSQAVANTMLTLSRQLGVRKDQFYRICMKSEYFMPVFIVTQRTKHYLALIAAKEGNVRAKPKLDVKGVALKSSKLPMEVRDIADDWYMEIMTRVLNNERFTPYQLMSTCATLEHYILDNISEGDPTFYRTSKVKDKEGYTDPWSNGYLYYDLWENVFAGKYGHVDLLPFTGKKVSVDMKRRDIHAWAATMDNGMGDKLLSWCEKVGKWAFTQIVVPVYVTPDGKMPKEFLSVVNARKLLSGLTEQFYIILECFGLYIKNEKNTVLCCDLMSKQQAADNMIHDVNFKVVGEPRDSK